MLLEVAGIQLLSVVFPRWPTIFRPLVDPWRSGARQFAPSGSPWHAPLPIPATLPTFLLVPSPLAIVIGIRCCGYLCDSPPRTYDATGLGRLLSLPIAYPVLLQQRGVPE